MSGLSFARLAEANRRRCETRWHPLDAWSFSDWMTAVAGEVGEAANAIKKHNRVQHLPQDARGVSTEDFDLGVFLDFPYDDDEEPGGRLTGREGIGYEIADAVIYLDLLCQRLGLDLGTMVERKFDIVSRRFGTDIFLGTPDPTSDQAAAAPLTQKGCRQCLGTGVWSGGFVCMAGHPVTLLGDEAADDR